MKTMPKNNHPGLRSVSETLILPLYVRAIESQRPDALLKDDVAVKLVKEASFDFSRIKHASHDKESQLALVLRNRQFDRYVQNFSSTHPYAVVVHMGCGLDSRFERVDNGKVDWYDLDLPEVIELRHELIGGEGERYHLLAYSALDPAWMDTVSNHKPGPFLLLAEGLFMYFEEAQVRYLVQELMEYFPVAQLIFDAFSPFYVWANNRRVRRTKFGSMAQWGLKNPKEIESWGDGIHLLDEWYPFLCNEPRLAHLRWARYLPLLSKAMGVYQYRLEKK
jgi:O-methyltransferase involved in polyketide biosynthesis